MVCGGITIRREAQEFTMNTISSVEGKKVTAFVAPLTNKKFVCIANNIPVCKSGDETYFERFYANDGITKLKGVEVERFVHLTATGKVDHIEIVSKTDQLISRLISKPSKEDRIQIKKESKNVIELVKTMRTQLVS